MSALGAAASASARNWPRARGAAGHWLAESQRKIKSHCDRLSYAEASLAAGTGKLLPVLVDSGPTVSVEITAAEACQ